MNNLLKILTILIASTSILCAGAIAKVMPNNIEFIPNLGQLRYYGMNDYANPNVKRIFDFYAKTNFGKILISRNGFSIQAEQCFKLDNLDEESQLLTNQYIRKNIATHFINVEFVGANQNAQVISENEKDGFLNFYNTESKPILGVKSYKKIVIKNLYQGIDLIFYENEKSEFEYDFIVSPNSNPNQIKMKFSSQDGISLDSMGNLEIFTRFNNLIKDVPNVYQNNILNKISAKYLINVDIVSFEIGNYDKTQTLIIDPVTRVKSSYYGGSGEDVIYKMKLDSKINQYYTGYTQSVNNISTVDGYQKENGGEEDVFLLKIDSLGNRVWATYFGGTGYDIAYDLAIDKDDNIFLTGETNSDTKIANINSHQSKFGGGYADGFLAKFNQDGTLTWSTYLGGKEEDKLNGVVSDDFGNAYVVGFSKSDNAIFSSGYQQLRAGKNDAIIIKFNPNGERTWGTYFGGTEDDFFNKVTIFDNEVYIVGTTQSVNLDVNINSIYSGSYDVLMTKFKASGNVDFSRYFGGSGFDSGSGIAWDSLNRVAIAVGSTKSTLTTKQAVQTQLAGLFDAAYYGANKNGDEIIISYFGGENNDFGNDITCVNGEIYLVGTTISQTGIGIYGYQNTNNGQQEGFLTKISSKPEIVFSTYYGGTNNDDIRSIVVTKDNYLLAGFTESSSNISTNDGFQTNYAGNTDGFFTTLKNNYFSLGSLQNSCVNSSVTFSANTNLTFNQNSTFKIEMSESDGNFSTNPLVLENKPNIGGIQSFVLSSDLLSDSIYNDRLIRIHSTSPEYYSSPSMITIYRKLKVVKSTSNICTNTPVIFSSNSNPQGSINKWELEDTTITSKNIAIQKSFKTIGLKKYKLTRTIPNACTEIDSGTVIVEEGPIYEIKTQAYYCLGSSGTFQVIRKDKLATPSKITNVQATHTENLKKISEGIYSFDNLGFDNMSNYFSITAEVESNCSNTYLIQKDISGSMFYAVKGELSPFIGKTYDYSVNLNFSGENQTLKWIVDTTKVKIISTNLNSCTLIFLKAGINSIQVKLTGNQSACSRILNLDVEAIGADKAYFTPIIDTICSSQSIDFKTETDTNTIIKWYFYGANDTLKSSSSKFSIDFANFRDNCWLKLVKTNKNNQLSDSIIRKIFVNANNIPIFQLKNTFCLGANKFDLEPKNENLTAVFSFTYKNGEIVDTTIKANSFIYNFNPPKKDYKGVSQYPFIVSLQISYVNKLTKCDANISYTLSVPNIYEPEIRYVNGNLETDSSDGYLWTYSINTTFKDRVITKPKNGIYTLKVKRGECYSYEATYILNVSDVDEKTKSDLLLVQNNNNLEVIFDDISNKEIKFSNMLGNLIYFANDNSSKVSIPVANLSSGVYFLEIDSGTEHIVKKIILEK